MRYLLLIVAVLLSGCAGMDIAGNQVTQAQAQYLAAQEAKAAREAESSRHVVDAIYRLAQSDDHTSRVVGLMMLDRVINGTVATQKAAAAPMQQQEGPITTALRVIAPFVLPLAQIWQADRAGDRSLKQSYANMNLIGTLAGQIQRDPLVVQNPTQIVNAPSPIIVDREVPVIVDRETPIVIDQPVVVQIPTVGG